MADEKWYQSEFGKIIGKYTAYTILFVGIGIGAGQMLKGYDTQFYKHKTQETIIEAETKTRNEFQRLRTIEEIVRTHGQKMSPDELKQFLKENNLHEKR